MNRSRAVVDWIRTRGLGTGVAILALAAGLTGCDRGAAPPGAASAPAATVATAAAPAPAAAPEPTPSPEPAKPDVAALLGLPDPATAESVGKLVEAAARSLAGEPIPDPDAVYKFLEKSIVERPDGVEFKKGPDEISRGAGELIEARQRWGSDAEAMLRSAAEQVQRAKWGYTSYTAKSDVLRALVTLYPSPAAQRFRFHADPGLARPMRPLPCPDADPRWSVVKKTRYFEDKTFTKLVALPDAGLPDGAIREAVALLAMPVVMNEFLQGGSGEVPPLADSVVARYGERALGCLFEALAEPAAAAKAVGGEVASLRYGAGKVAAKLPTEASVKLFRAALVAGWTDWSRELPATPAHQALAKELGDGPYLPAFQSPYRLRS